jgi:3',5'-cyclic AMP phosphodiesterase CpdA
MREEQTVWLDSVLRNNPSKWTIATFHHPIFSSAKERDNKELRELWKPVFDKYGVDLVLQGHDHSYARGQAGPFTKNELEGVNKRDAVAGTAYVVSVSGGKMYTLETDLWDNYEAKLERKAENTQLFQVISVEDDKLRYEAFTVTGALYDSFDLIKNGRNGKNKFVDRKNYSESERLHGNTLPVYENKK